LISTSKGSSASISTHDANGSVEHLGPNPKLLQLKLEKEQQEKMNRLHQHNQQVRVKQMSEEEKSQRLKEMERDAIMNDTLRQHRHSSNINNNNNHHDHINSGSTASNITMKSNDNNDGENSYTGNAKFLQSMRKEVYSSASTMDVSARIDQNKHYRQSSIDIDSSDGFLKR